MSELQEITLTFKVYDNDLPSERRAQYRQAAIDAMAKYKDDMETAIDMLGDELIDPDATLNVELIDKMLEDCNR